MSYKSYRQPAREAMRRSEHHRTLVESGEAQAGIYYWIPMQRAGWDLMAFFEAIYGSDLMHHELWKKEVVPYLLAIWKPDLDLRQVDEFRNAYAGLPRGRVIRLGQRFVQYHGGDAPTRNAQSVIKKSFGIRSWRSVLDDHEHTLEYDREVIKSCFHWI